MRQNSLKTNHFLNCLKSLKYQPPKYVCVYALVIYVDYVILQILNLWGFNSGSHQNMQVFITNLNPHHLTRILVIRHLLNHYIDCLSYDIHIMFYCLEHSPFPHWLARISFYPYWSLYKHFKMIFPPNL